MPFRALIVGCVSLLGCSSADPLHSPLRSYEPQIDVQTPETPVLTQAAVEAESARNSVWSLFNRVRGDEYALDHVARRVDSPKRVKCDPSQFQLYKGTNVTYAGPVRVVPAFVERLARFEHIVNQVAVEVYGRAPKSLIHAGAYSCRTSRNRNSRLSEHALGNALDVVGFNFARVPKAQLADTPKSVQGPFKVTVLSHWSAERTEQGRMHREFLRRLTAEVVAQGVFRVALGPSHPGHKDHLHFDMSPWNYVRL